MKLQRYTYCTKPGHDGCVNTEGSEWAPGGWMHWCPGCREMHAIPVEKPGGNGHKWTFNGNLSAPTFAPSVKIDFRICGEQRVCHYFIEDGTIKFCGDSTHELAGQNLPLPDIPKHERE